MSEKQLPTLPTLLLVTLEVWLLLIAATVLMTGKRPEAASPAVCGSAEDVLALASAMDQLHAAEIAEQQVLSNGDTYVAAKIGPIPGDELNAASARSRDDLQRAQRYLAVIARKCRENAFN